MPRRFVLSFWNHALRIEARRGTRIPCEIRLKLTGFDPHHQFSESCLVVVANLQGCGVKLGRALEAGTRVRLQGLPGNDDVTAQVVHCILLAQYERLWFAGLALDKPGNVWGVTNPPDDWGHDSDIRIDAPT